MPKNILFVSESGVNSPEDIKISSIWELMPLCRSPYACGKKFTLDCLKGRYVTKIKLCGIKSEDDIKVINEVLPDYIGFVFAEKAKDIYHLIRQIHLKASLITE